MKREEKKARTRETIAAAALQLFAERGFDGTTADDIAAASGISRRTFFRYFPTKEDVFFAQRQAQLDAFRRMIDDPLPGEDGFGITRRALLHLASVYMGDRRGAAAQQAIVRTSRSLMAHELQMDYAWEEAIAASLRRDGAGIGLSHEQCGWLAGACMGMTRAVLRQWFEADAERDLVAMGAVAVDRLAGGCGLGAGRGT